MFKKTVFFFLLKKRSSEKNYVFLVGFQDNKQYCFERPFILIILIVVVFVKDCNRGEFGQKKKPHAHKEARQAEQSVC